MKELKVNISDELYEQLFTTTDKGSLLLKLLEKELDILIEPSIKGPVKPGDLPPSEMDETSEIAKNDGNDIRVPGDLMDAVAPAPLCDTDKSSPDSLDPSDDLDSPSDPLELSGDDPLSPSDSLAPSSDLDSPSDPLELSGDDPLSPSDSLAPSSELDPPSDPLELSGDDPLSPSDFLAPSADLDSPSDPLELSGDDPDIFPVSDVPFEPVNFPVSVPSENQEEALLSDDIQAVSVEPEDSEVLEAKDVPEAVPLMKCDDMSFIYGALMGLDERLHGMEDLICELRAILTEMKRSSGEAIKPIDDVDSPEAHMPAVKLPYKVLSFPDMGLSKDQSSKPSGEIEDEGVMDQEEAFLADICVNDNSPINEGAGVCTDPSLPFPELDISAINDGNPSIDPFHSDDLNLPPRPESGTLFSADIIPSDNVIPAEEDQPSAPEPEKTPSGFMQDPLKASILTYLPYGSLVKKQVIITLLSKRHNEKDVDSRIDRMLSEGVISNIVKDDTVYLTRITGD